jgi:catechol 2,3-dioxygenase-like lactoylglutathione lyase family enzyme
MRRHYGQIMNECDAILGHVVLNVADLKKSERFYRFVLGMHVSARNRRTKMIFLSFGREHHDVALQELPPGISSAPADVPSKLHHFCIYVNDPARVDALYPMLKRRKVPVVSGPETLEVAGNRSISFLDPDGNRVEVACNAHKFQFDSRKQRQTLRRDDQSTSAPRTATRRSVAARAR